MRNLLINTRCTQCPKNWLQTNATGHTEAKESRDLRGIKIEMKVSISDIKMGDDLGRTLAI